MKKTVLTLLAVLTAAASAGAAVIPDFDGRPGAVLFLELSAPVPAASATSGSPAMREVFFPEKAVPPAFGIQELRGPSRGAALSEEDRLAEFAFVTGKVETVYSHLEGKQKTYGFSYEALKADYLRLVQEAGSAADYQGAVTAFIAAFRDPHTRVFFNKQRDRAQPQPPVTNALTEDGILITRIATLSSRYEEAIKRGLEESLELAKGAKALVVDVRGNNGGNDAYTSYYLSRLTDHPVPTGKITIKISSETLARYNGDLEEDPTRPGWTPWYSGQINPTGDSPFKGPVAFLIDGDCVSSCEGTAMRFKFSGMAKLYGAATMGSSGYPVEIKLPYSSGSIYLSTWINHMPDDTPIEDHGIEPDVSVNPNEALSAALADIRAAFN